jgi:cell division protein FtsB
MGDQLIKMDNITQSKMIRLTERISKQERELESLKKTVSKLLEAVKALTKKKEHEAGKNL